MISRGGLLYQRRFVYERNPHIFQYLMRHVFCLSVMVRFSHNSFDNSLSTLEFLSHLCSSCILFAKSLRLRFMSFLKMCFPLVSNGGFVWHFLHRVPPIFLKVVWVEFACACGALVAL